jgi:ribosome-binding factor A
MDFSRRQKRVGSLIMESLGRVFVEEIQSSSSGIITITRVEVSADLKTAHVYLSVFGDVDKEALLDLLEKRKGYLRKSIASEVKLKYNPALIFSLDPTPEYETRIDRLIEQLRKDEK